MIAISDRGRPVLAVVVAFVVLLHHLVCSKRLKKTRSSVMLTRLEIVLNAKVISMTMKRLIVFLNNTNNKIGGAEKRVGKFCFPCIPQ